MDGAEQHVVAELDAEACAFMQGGSHKSQGAWDQADVEESEITCKDLLANRPKVVWGMAGFIGALILLVVILLIVLLRE